MFKRVAALFYFIFHKLVTRDEFRANMGYWFAIDGDNKYLLKHRLNSKSIVFEVGGYTGVFTGKLLKRYQPQIYVFEPVKQFVKELNRKFGKKKNVFIYDFGLGASNKQVEFNLVEDETSLYRKSEKTELVEIVDIADFVKSKKIKQIDLMSVNIEGGEYELLERIIDTGIVKRIKFIQMQFHNVVDNALVQRGELIDRLLETHEIAFSVPFVWEGFRLKS